jgi:hypothetical protein
MDSKTLDHIQAGQGIGYPNEKRPDVNPVNIVRRGGRLLARLSSAERKEYPVTRGVVDYFPDALTLIARLSWAGNEKHNPGEPLHWARSKGGDNPDCIGRHLIERDGYDYIELQDGRCIEIPHRVAMVWRALAELQLWAEQEYDLDISPGASA